jgi:hypothetical protein
VVGFVVIQALKQLTKEKVNYFMVQPNQVLKLTERAHCKIHGEQRFSV